MKHQTTIGVGDEVCESGQRWIVIGVFPVGPLDGAVLGVPEHNLGAMPVILCDWEYVL